ncbi:MAG: cysteine synthase family protein [Pseudomonadota bacterium]|nr:cysteine synthase family protein [Pseudomonadota bacterium]
MVDNLVGNTPLYKTRNINVGICNLFLKMESMNVGGSIKDRIATAMLDNAEQQGLLKPGMTIIESTVGNTGLALAQVASQRGYKIIIVAPDKISAEKVLHLKASGAELIITSSSFKKGDPKHYQEVARSMAANDKNLYYVDQFNNAANPEIHEKTTAPEIWQQVDNDLDTIVTGAGTGGHLTGIGNFFKKISKEIEIVLADPQGSVLAKKVRGEKIVSSPGKVEGVGHDYVPKTCKLEFVNEAISISDSQAFAAARLLLRKEGILAGPSTGVTLAASIKYCQAQTRPKKVVSFVYDTGNKYLSKIYNDKWLDDNGYDVNAINKEFMDDN